MKKIKFSFDSGDYNKGMELITIYGTNFWADFFVYLCVRYPVKNASEIYSNILKLYFNV